MKIRADRNPEARAGLNLDVRVSAPLTDQAQLGQTFEEGRADLSALADQDQSLETLKPLREPVGVLDVVREDSHLMALETLEARQRSQCVEPVVKDRDSHRTSALAY